MERFSITQVTYKFETSTDLKYVVLVYLVYF